MRAWTDLSLEEVNGFLKDRGVEILHITHPDPELEREIPMSVLSLFKFEDVDLDFTGSEVVEMGWHSLNRLLEERGVLFKRLTNPLSDKLKDKFTIDFFLPLRYHVKVHGSFRTEQGYEGHKVARWVRMNYG